VAQLCLTVACSECARHIVPTCANVLKAGTVLRIRAYGMLVLGYDGLHNPVRACQMWFELLTGLATLDIPPHCLASEHIGQVCAATVYPIRAFRCVSARSGTSGKWVQDPRDMFQPRLCTQPRRSARSLIPINPKGHRKIHGGDLVGHLPWGRVLPRRLSRTLEGIGCGGSSKAAG
jgi:hypothetical protein